MIRINLLPTKAAKRKESVIQQTVVGMIIVGAFAVSLWFVDQHKGGQIEAQRETNRQLQADINELAGVIAQVEDFKKKKADRNSKIDVIRKLHEGRSGPVKMMDEFTYTLPDKLWLLSWKEKGSLVEMAGIGLNGAIIADFIDSLRASKYFSNVLLIQTQLKEQAKEKMQQFKITMNVNYTPN